MTIQGSWKSDGLDADGKASWSLEEEESSNLLSIQVSGGSPMNLLYTPTAAPSPTKHYLQVKILNMESRSASIGVGVARPSEFQKGYKTRGMFYNGNLTNGSAALKVSYGPRPKQNDSISVEYEETQDGFIQVSFHVNGKSLGTGFRIRKQDDSSNTSTASESSFLPCLHAQGKLTVRVAVSTEKPESIAKEPDHPLEGEWKLLQAFGDDDDSSKEQIWPLDPATSGADGKSITLHMEPSDIGEENDWFLGMKVANSLRVQKKVSKLAAATYQISGPSGVMSTRMLPPPPFDKIEGQLSNAMGSRWVKFSIVDDNGPGETLQALSEDGTILAVFGRPPQPDLSTAACNSYQ